MADIVPQSAAPSAPFPGALPPHSERRAVVGTLAAELGHDLNGPLNLLGSTAERLERGEPLTAEDVALLREEVTRLGRLRARLRELARASLQKVPCSPLGLIEAALGLCPPTREFEVQAAATPSVMCDPRLVSQALRELFDNALEAKASRAGVRFERGASTGFCVWDDGPGFALEGNAALSWGATTRLGAAGLGLTLALRAARAHGFDLQLRRAAPYTEVWLLIPERELSPPVAP